LSILKLTGALFKVTKIRSRINHIIINIRNLFLKMASVLKEGAKGIDATHGSIIKKLLIIAVPLMLTFLMNNLYELTDNFWLGRYSDSGIASAQIGRQLIFFFMSLGMGLGMGGTTLVSQAKGSGRKHEVGRYAAQTLFILLFISLIASAIAIIFPRPILSMLGTPASIMDDTVSYISIILGGAPVLFYTVGFAVILNGTGNTLVPFTLTTITVLLNVFLDPIFIFGIEGVIPSMGVSGAAIATVICRSAVALIGTWYMFKGKAGFQISLRDFAPSMEHIKKILRIGIPGSLGSWGTSLGFVILMSVVSRVAVEFYGGEPTLINAYGISHTIISLYFMVTMGLGQGVGVVVGQNIGADKEERAEKSIWKGFWIALVLMTIGTTFMFFFAGDFSKLFIPDTVEYSLAVAGLVQRMLRITAFGVIAFGLTSIIIGAFQGTGKTIPIMSMNLFRLWGLRLPSAVIMAFGINVTILGFHIDIAPMAADGIFWAMNISNLVIFAIAFSLFITGKWKRKSFVGRVTPEEASIQKAPTSKEAEVCEDPC
jgi:putative MATE family efflux protein